MTLRWKFVLVFVLFAATLTAAGGWLAWRTASEALEAELDEKLLWVAGAAAETGLSHGGDLISQLQPGDDEDEEALYHAYHERLIALEDAGYVDEAYIFAPDNTSLLSSRPSDSLPIGTPIRWLEAYETELEEAWETGGAVTPVFRGEDGRHYKFGFKQLDDYDAMLAVLMRADHLQPLARLQRNFAVGSVLAALVAALLAGLLATNVIRPLESLSRVALRIQRGHLDRPVDVDREDEVGRLSRAMERMREGILHRDEQLRLMLAQVAHEIRNPLGSLELFASAAAETDDRDERHRLMGRIRSEVQELNEIINEFLTFARPVEPHVRVHDVRKPIREATDFLAVQMAESGGHLDLRLPEDPLMVRADPEHVKRVVLNLVQNAAEAGQRVAVSARWHNGEVLLTVADDGPGIPPELRERIFEPFVTDKEQGAGLGLAIVRRVLERNGARIRLADGNVQPLSGHPEAAVDEPEGARPQDGVHLGGAVFHVFLSGSEDLPASDLEEAQAEPATQA